MVVRRADADRIEGALADAGHGSLRVGEIVAGSREVRLS
jgi:hypothetical protein